MLEEGGEQVGERRLGGPDVGGQWLVYLMTAFPLLVHGLSSSRLVHGPSSITILYFFLLHLYIFGPAFIVRLA